MSLIGKTVDEQIWNKLFAEFQNSYGVAGLMGNIQAESSLKSTNLQCTYNKKFGLSDEEYTDKVDSGEISETQFVNDKAGYGLVQWTYYSLKQFLYDFCKSRNTSIGDLEMQLDCIIAQFKRDYPSVYKTLQTAKDVRTASDAVLLKFERPADQSVAVQEKRASYGQTFYDKFSNTVIKEKEETKTMGIEIRKDICATSPCNKSGKEIDVKGIMLHSVGCPQPKPEVFANIWKTSTNACVHSVLGVEPYAIQCLPTFPERKKARRGWHGASGKNGSVNNTHLSLEMTEPATIKYTGGASWVETGDGSNTKRHVLATYANAVQLFAMWCKEFNLDPLADGVIISHHEGNLRGVASNHGDVEHIWKKFGLTMNQFRQDVKSAMQGIEVTTVPTDLVDNSSDDTSNQSVNTLNGTVTITYKGKDGINIRTAPSITSKVNTVAKAGDVFTVVGISKDEKWYKLKSGLFVTTIPDYVSFKATPEQKASTSGTGYYRVRKSWDKSNTQIGAFKDVNNAIELCKQNSGYKVFDNDGKEVYPLVTNTSKEFKFEVTIPDLRIRKGAGTTYDYWKKNGSAVYTGKGVFTIVKTKDGQGAKQWGLLKSYADKENGWIALDEAFGKRV